MFFAMKVFLIFYQKVLFCSTGWKGKAPAGSDVGRSPTLDAAEFP